MSYEQSCKLVFTEVSKHGEVPENFSDLIANSDQDFELFDKDVEALNVVDVYKIAASIGKEFERLTDAFGGVVFSGAMPKIIRILEMFELLVKSREHKEAKISTLMQQADDLDKKLKLKNISEAKEMTKLHAAWEENVKELKRRNKQLDDDNKKLLNIVSDQNESSVNEEDFVEQLQKTAELEKEKDGLKEEIRTKNRIINEHQGDCNALQSQVDRLAKINNDLRQKVSILQQQATSLINDKSALESRLSAVTKANNLPLRSQQAQTAAPKHEKREESLQQEEDEGGDDKKEDARLESTHQRLDDPLLANKLVIDLNDPNRPRYTLSELLEVLNDRNQLKARCFRLEEELIFYKDVARSMGYADESWEEINAREVRQLAGLYPSSSSAVSDTAVTGETSGIRRFFSYLTSDLWGKRDLNMSGPSSSGASPQPRRRTRPSTYHEAKNDLVDEEEVSDLAPRLLLDTSSASHNPVIVRSSSEMFPLGKRRQDDDDDDDVVTLTDDDEVSSLDDRDGS